VSSRAGDPKKRRWLSTLRRPSLKGYILIERTVMWIVFRTATTTDVLDAEQKDTIIKALRLLILVGNEEESLIASKLLHDLLP